MNRIQNNFSLLALKTISFLLIMIGTFNVSAQYPAVINVSDLDGEIGFSMNGLNAGDWLGYSVGAAGDINNDGIDDFMVAALFNDESNIDAGVIYIVYGKDGTMPAVFDLSTLDGTNGFKLIGDNENDHAGFSINNAGDINHDGKNDIVITAQNHAPPGLTYNGATYILFGADSFPASINFYGKSTAFASEFDLDDINGVNGIVFYGDMAGDIAGSEVRDAGDFNADGIDDILISALRKGTNGIDSGTVYLVFGHASNWGAVNHLGDLNGSNGIIINGVSANNFLGLAIDGGGDFNQDGFDDILMSAQFTAEGQQKNYLILGRSGPLVAEQDVSLWADLTIITGTTDYLSSPYDYSTSFAGDVNGDGLSDIVIGDFQNSTNKPYAGAAYVVFGSRSITNPIITSDELTGQLGFGVFGENWDGSVGASVSSAGDVNHDGVDDFMFGGFFVDSNGTNSGSAFVVYGNDGIFNDAFE